MCHINRFSIHVLILCFLRDKKYDLMFYDKNSILSVGKLMLVNRKKLTCFIPFFYINILLLLYKNFLKLSDHYCFWF